GSISTENINCFGSNTGSVSITGSNGTSPYQYSLDGITFQASGSFSGLSAGNYNAIVRDANGCVSPPLPFSISEPSSAISVTLTSKTNVLCFGSSTGAINITEAGGTGPY